MTELAPGYTAQCDNIDKDTWDAILDRFDDANIYQTWAYEAVHSGEENLSHLLLEKEGKLVAAAQVRLAKLRSRKIRIAYVRWGPMWHPCGTEGNIEDFRQALRALRNEYVGRRRCALRLLPFLFDDEADLFHPLFAAEGYGHPFINLTHRLLIMSVERPVEELKRGLHEKWRYNLRAAEKHALRVEEGTEDRLFQAFLDTYTQTHERKRFVQTSDVPQYRKIQQGLSDPHRMRIFVAYHNDEPAAGVICSCMGKMGVFLYAGTSTSALPLRPSYVLQWRAVNWVKEQGAKYYYLGGINKARNPGTRQFKSGLCGKNGVERGSVGSYDAYHSPIFGALFQAADLARVAVRETRISLHAYRLKRRMLKEKSKPLPAG